MPIRSRAEYTTYSFTASAAIDYNYDPSPDNEPFDPYSDDTSSSSPLQRQCPPPPPPIPIPIQPRIPTSPSPQYLAESQKPSTQLPTPSASRKLLVLDLNGTLVYRTPHVRREFRPRRRAHYNNNNNNGLSPTTPGYDDPYADPKAPRPLRTVHARPYMRSFREYLFHPRTRTWLDTMVWSSAQPHSVADMVERCFGSRRDELVAVWARDTLGLEEKDYHQKTQTTKDLARPWSKLRLPLRPPATPSLSPSPSSSSSLPPSPPSSSPPSTPTPQSQVQSQSQSYSHSYAKAHAESQSHSAHTTLLLDDSPRKAHLQPYNHLCIREYSGTLRNADLRVRAAAARRGEGAHIAGGSSSSMLYTRVGVGDANATCTPPGPVFEGADTKKRKRDKKKNGTTTHHLPSHNGSGSGGSGGADGSDYTEYEYDYDPTLLAVIGVLERIKWEANVAGWMRAGGLRTAVPSKVLGQVLPKAKAKREGSVVDDNGAGAGASADVGVDVGTESGGGSEMKKRRLGKECEYPGREELDELDELERGDGVGGGAGGRGGGPPAVNPGEIGDTGQWFEDAAALGHWVRAGVRALEGLGVEVWAGVDG